MEDQLFIVEIKVSSPSDNDALNVSRFLVVKYVKYTAFFLSDGAWDIAEPMLEDLSTKPISCLHAMGQEMWAASGGYIYKMILRPHSDGGITVEKVSLNFLCYKMCKFKSKEQQSFSSLHFSRRS